MRRGNVGHIYGEGTGAFANRPFDIFGVYSDNMLTALTAKPNDTPPQGQSISIEDWLKVWHVNDWNTARVRVVGDPVVVTTWINGTQVCEFNGNTFQAKNYDPAKVRELLGAKGSIAVQVHGGKSWPVGAKCRWKNILVKEL